jgi:hypothetical protein
MIAQILVHLWGDFVFQSDWMAMNKSKRSFNCLIHVLIYTSFFLLLTISWKALLVISVTHFLIDRFPIIVKRLIWFKNHLNPKFKYVPFKYCNITGYYDDFTNAKLPAAELKQYGTPRLFGVTIWLYIITDNLLHLTINYFAIKYL